MRRDRRPARPSDHEHRAARGLGALDGALEVRDADVAEPVRAAGLALGAFVEHAAELPAVAAKDEVHAHRPHVVLGDQVPIEQRRIKTECDVRSCRRRELVPRELAGFGRRLGLRRRRGCVNAERGALRVDEHGIAAAVRQSRRRRLHAAAETRCGIGRRVDVGRADVRQPLRCARALLDRPADRPALRSEHLVSRVLVPALDRPAGDLAVELLRARAIRRKQLVPDESAANGGVCHTNLRCRFERGSDPRERAARHV